MRIAFEAAAPPRSYSQVLSLALHVGLVSLLFALGTSPRAVNTLRDFTACRGAVAGSAVACSERRRRRRRRPLFPARQFRFSAQAQPKTFHSSGGCPPSMRIRH